MLAIASVFIFGYKNRSSTHKAITQAQAESIISQLPEVQKRLSSGNNWAVLAEDRDSDSWFVQVAEVVNEGEIEGKETGHTATFNWYKVDRKGEVVCSMFTYDKEGNLEKDIEPNDCN